MEIRIKLPENKANALEPQVALFNSSEDKDPDEIAAQKERLNEVCREINQLIGLQQVKELLFEVQAFATIQRKRQSLELKAEPSSLHAVFRGNPGSGKTTLARLLARLYKESGILSRGQLIEVERADLVGEYIGHTAQKTKELLAKAKGGILFIDEAYSLARGGNKDFGRESIDAIVKAMEDYRDDLVIIMAGYRDEMTAFLDTNPGLNSRFPLHIDFPDYSARELLQIAEFMYQEREYRLSAEAKILFARLIDEALRRWPQNHGNARLVRNIVEASLRKQAVRLVREAVAPSAEALQLLLPVDLQIDISRLLGDPASSRKNNCVPLYAAY